MLHDYVPYYSIYLRDGTLAVRMLQRAGITVALLSGGRGGAIEHRARHLDIVHCCTGVGDKKSGLEQLRSELAMTREQTAYLGDDLNDLVVKSVSGVLIAPSNAASALQRQADWVLRHPGGDGALRELTEGLLQSKDLLIPIIQEGIKTSI